MAAILRLGCVCTKLIIFHVAIAALPCCPMEVSGIGWASLRVEVTVCAHSVHGVH